MQHGTASGHQAGRRLMPTHWHKCELTQVYRLTRGRHRGQEQGEGNREQARADKQLISLSELNNKHKNIHHWFNTWAGWPIIKAKVHTELDDDDDNNDDDGYENDEYDEWRWLNINASMANTQRPTQSQLTLSSLRFRLFCCM